MYFDSLFNTGIKMKKLLLSLSLLLALTFSANAQSIKRPNPNHHHHQHMVYSRPAPHRHVQHIPDYVGDVRLHIMGSIGDGDLIQMFHHYNPDMFMLGGMLEYQAGSAVALGLGAEFYGSYCGWNLPYPELNYYTYSLPVYGNLRLMIPSGEVRPFIEGRIGYAIPLSSAFSYHYNTNLQAAGLYTGAGVGFIVGQSSFSFGVNVTDLYDMGNTTPGNNRQAWDYFNDYYFRYSYAFGL